MFSWLQARSRPLVVAHRGSSVVAPENTLAAFRQALEDGAQAIELDVRLTADEEVIIFHDRNLNRTTNGRGKAGRYRLAELRRLSAGSWFHPKFAREKIPT